MTSTQQHSNKIQELLKFWFDHPDPLPRWFKRSDELDAEIRRRFGDLITQARSSQLKEWSDTPDGTLALLILLDQFPRNVFRDSGEAFASDAQARDVAATGVARDFDQKVPYMRQAFFYLPFMHDEGLLGQIAARSFYFELGRRCHTDEQAKNFAEASLKMTRQHMDAILHFGRFPGRNKALGRQSTPEELAFLQEHPQGF